MRAHHDVAKRAACRQARHARQLFCSQAQSTRAQRKRSLQANRTSQRCARVRNVQRASAGAQRCGLRACASVEPLIRVPWVRQESPALAPIQIRSFRGELVCLSFCVCLFCFVCLFVYLSVCLFVCLFGSFCFILMKSSSVCRCLWVSVGERGVS